jgi:hypothetical protein
LHGWAKRPSHSTHSRKKSDKKFEWTEEADVSFAHLKKVLSMPPVLDASKGNEPLLLYIAATYQVVCMVLVVERSEEGKAHGVQKPVYFLSEVLSLTLPALPKTHIQHVHDSMQIATLLRGSPDNSG